MGYVLQAGEAWKAIFALEPFTVSSYSDRFGKDLTIWRWRWTGASFQNTARRMYTYAHQVIARARGGPAVARVTRNRRLAYNCRCSRLPLGSVSGTVIWREVIPPGATPL
ncbi:hypothetical protein EYF80_034750 [Liparis tanakae]|uniref:Uncharacterized protein n=1 Tax=Liparis tanakae TaxID=230148 RepID=A0A4Z2GQP8_9TELE|nr:hypothetical protein EYF80_034750 [Liparis tanakae]